MMFGDSEAEILGEVQVQQKCISSVAPCRANVSGRL